MKKYKMLICIAVIFILLFQNVVFASSELPVASTDTESSMVIDCLQGYFEKLMQTLDYNSSQVYKPEDFASINGYIIAKILEWDRDSYKYTFEEGIENVKVYPIELKDFVKFEEYYEASVLVKYKYIFNSNEENEGVRLYRVTLTESNGQFTVIDLDTVDDYVVMDLKAGLQFTAKKEAVNEVDFVNSRIEEWYKALYSTPEIDLTKEAESEAAVIKDTEVQAKASYSYDSYVAALYAFKCAGVNWYENYIFRRTAPDCTNFISQCVWAGYGGTSGYTLPATPSVSNSAITALRNRVANDYRMTSSWYGRNYYSSNLNDPPAKWCGVVEFYSYVTGSDTYGPKATGYNNGNIYTSLGSTTIAQGNIVQFYSNELGRYSHSAIVTTATSYTVANASSVRVSQHSGQDNNRNLMDAIQNSGGQKMRLLKFKSASFNQ